VTTPPDVPDLPSLEEAFELGPELGAGGFGVVHRATRRADGVDAAVKLPRADVPLAEPSRVVREARILEDLDHPHLVRFLGLYRTQDGTLALAYELVPGRPLDQVLAEARLPFPRAMAILAGVAAGLDHLHAAGLIHRDLKPENVMLSPGDHPKLLDFGLARPIAPGATLTAAGIIAGTPRSMAPEILRGEPATVRSDLFALGCVAFELLAGSAPYPEDLAEVVAAHAKEGSPPASTRCPELPRSIDAPLAAALARDPAARPPSGAALVRELETALEAPDLQASRTVVLEELGTPAEVPTPLAFEKPAPPRRVAPVLLGVVALAAAALATLTPRGPAPAAIEQPAPVTGGLPPGFSVDYADSLERFQGLHVVGNELLPEAQVPADAPRTFRAIRDPRFWGELRRHLDPALATFERWVNEGGRPEELPPHLLESLRALDDKLVAENRSGFSPPLYPFLEVPDLDGPLAPPMGSRSLNNWKGHLPHLDPSALAPAGGWLGRVYLSLRVLHRRSAEATRELQRMLRGEEVALDVPTPSDLGAVFLARGVRKHGTYLDTVWSQIQDRPKRRRYAQGLLPVVQAAHRTLYAAGRALDELPDEELDSRAHLLFFLLEDLTAISRESYLTTLRPEEVLLPVQDTLHWHLLASTHARYVVRRRRHGPYPGPVSHLARALELARERPVPEPLLYLLRQQVVVSGTYPGYLPSDRVRAAMFEVIHQGTPEDWARYGHHAPARLAWWFAEQPSAHPWPLADLRRVDVLLRAWEAAIEAPPRPSTQRTIDAFRARLASARAREGG
jgi:hypothetical protein